MPYWVLGIVRYTLFSCLVTVIKDTLLAAGNSSVYLILMFCYSDHMRLLFRRVRGWCVSVAGGVGGGWGAGGERVKLGLNAIRLRNIAIEPNLLYD